VASSWGLPMVVSSVRDTELGCDRHDGTVQERATGGCSGRLVRASEGP
jgi:hypothetical protein